MAFWTPKNSFKSDLWMFSLRAKQEFKIETKSIIVMQRPKKCSIRTNKDHNFIMGIAK